MTAFVEFANSIAGDKGREFALERLATEIHPLALGNVRRSIARIKELAGKMVGLTNATRSEEAKVRLITRLTTEFYAHDHLVNRTEAAGMGLNVTRADGKLEDLLMDYYDELCADLELLDPLDVQSIVAQMPTVPIRFEQALIETPITCDAFVSLLTVVQPVAQPAQIPGGPAVLGSPVVSLRGKWESVV